MQDVSCGDLSVVKYWALSTGFVSLGFLSVLGTVLLCGWRNLSQLALSTRHYPLLTCH